MVPPGGNHPESAADGPLSETDALRRMYRITSNHEQPFEEQIRNLLELGRTYLDVEVGFLSKISEDTQRIVEASGDHELLQPGKSCPLSESYCRKTVKRDDCLTVQHAKIEGWENDSAYHVFGLESYIGAKVVVDGELYGTFCFADSEPRAEPFTDEEEVFAELMAERVGYERFNRRATERILHQRDQLEEFTKVVSHDLRNPLNAAQVYLELAKERGNAEHFDRCGEALDRMEALIGDLLTLARDTERTVEPETIELSELVPECWSFVATEEATLDVDTEMTIEGDASRLQQVFENLFRNAIEHGGSDVTIRVGELADGAGLYVEDDGPGIPPDDREQVFDDGYTTRDQGTGFGLPIVKQVAHAHGWEVDVTGGTDGGARFRIAGIEAVDR